MRCVALLAVGLAAAAPTLSIAVEDGEQAWTGREIMREVFERHEQFPYVYEEQTMVLMDAAGNREVRKSRRYTRVEEDGTVRFLLVFDYPAEIRGAALLAVRAADGSSESGVYLPAFGAEFRRPAAEDRSASFLGTDFTVEDLTVERAEDFRYVLNGERNIDEVDYFVVDAYPADEQVERATGHGLRRHLVRKQNFVVEQTDFFDRRLRPVKRLSRHDLRPIGGDGWRASMVVADDQRDDHRTLLKIDRRVYSRDYVPAELFEQSYLLANRHVEGAAVGPEMAGHDVGRDTSHDADGSDGS